MSSCLGNRKVLCGLLFAGSIVASVAQSRAETSGNDGPIRELGRRLGLVDGPSRGPVEVEVEVEVSGIRATESMLPEGVRAIVAGLRARSDGIAMMANERSVAEGERLLRQRSIDLARDSEAVITRSSGGVAAP